MENIILLACCLLLGVGLKHWGILGDSATLVLNRLIIYFFIPLIALHHVPKIEFKVALIWLTLTPFIVFIGSMLFFQFMQFLFKWDVPTKAALILTTGISSTSFVGFPIFEILYGAEGLAYGVLLSLGGTILVFNTLGIGTLFYYTNLKANWLAMLKKIFTFIPFVSFLLAVILNIAGISFPFLMDEILEKLTAPFSVIALLTIGMQINLRLNKSIIQELLLGHLYKLIIAPLLIYVLVWLVFDVQDLVGRLCVMGAGIGCMNAMSILTAEKGLRPQLATLMPAISIPISIPLLFLIDLLLQ